MDGLPDWDLKLLSATMAMNKVVSSSTGHSPFMLMHGWEPLVLRGPISPRDDRPGEREEIRGELEGRVQALRQARESSLANIERAQERQVRSHARRNQVPVASSAIRVGSLVKLYNARKRTRQGYSGTSYLGPYTVTRIDQHGMCILRSQDGHVLRRKHPMSKLAPFHEEPQQELEAVVVDA